MHAGRLTDLARRRLLVIGWLRCIHLSEALEPLVGTRYLGVRDDWQPVLWATAPRLTGTVSR